MSRDLVIQATRQLRTVKSGRLETQMTRIPLRDYYFGYQIKEEIASHSNFKDQLETYLKYWEEIGEPTVSGNWIVYDEEAKESEWWVDEGYVLTDIVFPESPDYEAILKEEELEFLEENPSPIAHIKERPYSDRLMEWVKELEEEDYECEIVRE